MDRLLGEHQQYGTAPDQNLRQQQAKREPTHGPSLSESARRRAERLTSTESDGSTVMSFHNINYEVDISKSPCCGRKVKKHILKDISGIFKPGMNAILGPTGSGKSSLLDVLAGRKDPKGLTGSILLDGLPPPDNFKCLVGYVVQDDVVMGTLTIRENFEFSAALRLPSTVTKAERRKRVDQVIFDLGLTEVADSKVGNQFIRGVSGGERKRCNIGMELIISPPVLFLDEPTTGLDASNSKCCYAVAEKRLSERGRNIIFSIHQPRFSIYRLFNSLMLLSHGDTVYHGPSEEALEYFASVGYICEEHNNPPDFFLDVINGDSTAVTSTAAIGTARDEQLKEDGAGGSNGLLKSENTSNDKNVTHHVIVVDGDNRPLKDLFRQSRWCARASDELNSIWDDHIREVNSGNAIQIRKIEYKSSFATQRLDTQWWQFKKRTTFIAHGHFDKCSVSHRSYRQGLNTVHKLCNTANSVSVTYLVQFAVIAIFALIVGAVYFKTSTSKDTAIQNRVGAFFFIIMNQVFGNMSAVELFITERAIFIHENVGGFYRVSAYFLSKVFCDVIPMRMIPVIIFSSIVYFMIDLRGGTDYFFIFSLNLFLTALSASALSFAISSTVRIFALANLCLALSYVFMMLFSGLLINIGDLAEWIRWIKYLSIFRFSLSALSINELKDREFCNVYNGTKECSFGNAYLMQQDIDYKESWDLWLNEVALAAMAGVFLVLAYIQLRRIKKLR